MTTTTRQIEQELGRVVQARLVLGKKADRLARALDARGITAAPPVQILPVEPAWVTEAHRNQIDLARMGFHVKHRSTNA